MGLRYPTEVNLWGDVKATLIAMLPHLRATADLGWQTTVANGMRAWEKEMEAQALLTYPDGVNPRRVFHELNKRLPPNSIVTAGAGTTADWYGHHIRLRRGTIGDGAFQMLGMNELIKVRNI